MLKGQLSRELWSGKSWIPCNFYDGLRALLAVPQTFLPAPVSYSHSSSTSLNSNWICLHAYELFPLFLSPKGFFQNTKLIFSFCSPHCKKDNVGCKPSGNHILCITYPKPISYTFLHIWGKPVLQSTHISIILYKCFHISHKQGL